MSVVPKCRFQPCFHAGRPCPNSTPNELLRSVSKSSASFSPIPSHAWHWYRACSPFASTRNDYQARSDSPVGQPGRILAAATRRRARDVASSENRISQANSRASRLVALDARFFFRFSEIRAMFGASRPRMRGASRSSRTLRAGCDGRHGAQDERCRYGRRRRVVLASRR
jgi:hypothetical protein